MTVTDEKTGAVSLEERQANLTMFYAQGKAYVMNEPIPCGCGCGRMIHNILRMYRCYYCGVFFSQHCAAEHFGGERPSLRRLRERSED